MGYRQVEITTEHLGATIVRCRDACRAGKNSRRRAGVDDVTITLRIGAALRKAIYDAAAADKRSMNSTITLVCEEWLAAKGYWTPKEPPKPSGAKVPFWKQPRKGGPK